jgi:hypothetical protein
LGTLIVINKPYQPISNHTNILLTRIIALGDGRIRINMTDDTTYPSGPDEDCILIIS